MKLVVEELFRNAEMSEAGKAALVWLIIDVLQSLDAIAGRPDDD